MHSLKQVIDRAVSALTSDFGATEVWLFGSSASGTAGEQSDVDLLLICPERPETPRPSVEARLCLFRHGIHCPFDILVLTPERWRQIQERPAGVYQEIIEHGIKLYEG
ncbi:MAG: nucleotidyltransferase domain-containing protein [Acidobacteria bacterium]|nr:nucleotidyltransferase domain-containing protein [Acidobacteriota bacterium]